VKRSEMVYAVRSSLKCWYFAVKKRLGGEGADVGLKVFVKYQNIGSGIK